VFDTRKAMGMVVRGSLSRGLEMKLAADVPIEELRAGKFVVVEGDRYEFFSMITDIALSVTTNDVLEIPPESPGSLLGKVIAGTSTYGTVTLRPMLMLPREGGTERWAPGSGLGVSLRDEFDRGAAAPPAQSPAPSAQRASEASLMPVKSIPGHFSPVLEATEEDVSRVFGSEAEGRQYFEVGTPLDMDAPVCLNLERFVERSNGIFGKSGTGKTFLTRMALCGIIQSGRAVNLVFDMHGEYGWEGTVEGGERASVRGLRQYFPRQVEVFTLDAESARRRGRKADYEIRIPYSQVTVEDIILLQEELNLSATAAETAYALVNEFREKWFERLMDLDLKAFCAEHHGSVHEGALAALKRKLSVLAHECRAFLRPDVTDDAVERIVADLERGRHIVVEFGKHRNPKQYMLVANILTRRIHDEYIRRKEAAMGGQGEEPRPLVITIEEAHKFLSPALANQTIFGTIARELRKYNVTLLVVDQRPSGIDTEVLSQVGTKVLCLLDDEKDIDAVLAGTSGAASLRGVLASLETKQQALLVGHAVPMPIVIRTRFYDDPEFARRMGLGSSGERTAEDEAFDRIFGGE
jgi:DNA helicase HerA-like ATPase